MRIERAGADILSFGQFCSRKFLASSSLRNVSVALACVRFPRGSSNDTYHVPWDLLAIIPSRGLRRAAHRRGRNLNRRLTKSFRLPPASPNRFLLREAGSSWPGFVTKRTSFVQISCSKISFSRRGDAADNPRALPRPRNMD
jgi:hypothetical protein